MVSEAAPLNPIEVHSVVSGRADGPAVVLSNSLGSTHVMWAPQLAELEERFMVIRYDTRGHGKSPVPAGPYSIDDLADDVIALLDGLGVERAHIVGLSLGGMTAMRLAARNPERVDRLVLLCTGAQLPPAEAWLERAATVREYGSGAVAEAVVARWFTPELREANPEARHDAEQMVAVHPCRRLRRVLRGRRRTRSSGRAFVHLGADAGHRGSRRPGHPAGEARGDRRRDSRRAPARRRAGRTPGQRRAARHHHTRSHRTPRRSNDGGQMTLNKVVGSAAEAVADIPDGASLAVGGFGLAGIPWFLIEALLEQGAGDLTVVSNNCGVDRGGLGLLLEARRISRVIASYVGENKEFARQYLAGELTVELTPQGTLAERMRAGGAASARSSPRPASAPWSPKVACPGATTPTAAWRWLRRRRRCGPSTAVRCCWRSRSSPIIALVRAAVVDKAGNCVFHAAARNFNPPAAMAGRVTIVEAERVVEVGELHPDEIHLPGIFVKRILELTPEQAARKGIEKLTTRPRPAAEEAHR